MEMIRRTKPLSVAMLFSFAALAMILSGCACMDTSPATVSIARTSSPPPAGACPQISQKDGASIYAMVFPTGNLETGVVMLEKTSPVEVNIDQPFDYIISATNLTTCPLEDVVVKDKLPDGFVIKSATPEAKVGNDGWAVWQLGQIPGGETRNIKVKAAATREGTFMHCANVTYNQLLCMTVAAVSPKLELTKQAPAEVLFCDPIPVTLVVKNPGTGMAKGVTVNDTLPAGLKTTTGEQSVSFDVGMLAPGESQTLTYTAKADKVGEYGSTAKASSAGGLSAEAAAKTIVRQPVLVITKEASDKQYAGRNIAYTITVENKGDAVAKALMITDTVPAGTSFVSASNNGAEVGGTIAWSVGDLAPGKKIEVKAVLRADQIARVSNTATAAAECADGVKATATTEILGIAAILLEVIDIEDPIEVGDNETYVITATNQGSLPDTNIQIVCTLEDAQSYVSATGDTSGTAKGKVITFAPLKSLAPGAKATWRAIVKAEKVGDIRIKVSMTSDQLTRPVEETEATNQY